ncbi:MAG TPA: extracellular solute-binding protein, partial [Verrucomicrobiae bacterium]|nr:extracellular solute-binding protein [Verrucomicrobiae bacterium]
MTNLFQRQLAFRALWCLAALGAVFLWGGRLRLSSPRPNLLRFSHTYTTESEQAILREVIEEFERAHPGVHVEQAIANSEVYQTVGWRLQFRGRQQPDIFFLWQGYKVEYAIEYGWALDVTPFLPPGFLDQFVPTAIRRVSGGLYHLPQSVDISNLVWYNQALFQKLGLSEPATIPEWLGACAALRRANLLPLGQGNRDLWPMGNWGAELLGQSLGAERLSQLFQPGRPVAPDQLGGLGAFVQMREQGDFDLPGVLSHDAIASLGDIDAKVLFLTGKSAQHVVGSWFLADIQDARAKNELKFPVGVFAVPSAPGETAAMTAVTTGFLVNRQTKNPRAAVDFLELLLSRKYQEKFARIGNLSARRDAVAFTTDPLAKKMLGFLASTPVTVPPPDTGYSPEQAAVFYELT